MVVRFWDDPCSHGATAAYAYDGAHRLTSLINRQLGGEVSAYLYQYDANGNRTRQTERNGFGEEITQYDFDTADRLREVRYPDKTESYTFDPAWNRVTEQVRNASQQLISNKTLSYNSRHQLTQISDSIDPAHNATFGYDANGNQTSKTHNGETTQFVFDVRNHLRSVTTGGSTVGQFLYDYRGLRTQKQGARGTERYSHDDLAVLFQSDEHNTLTARYEYGSDRLLSLTPQNQPTEFYLFDALNSPTALTRADGSISARTSFDAWGNKRRESGESFNRFGFTGHEHDEETGLIYAKARYYDPETARFLRHDPWEGDQTIPPSLHKYLYAYQNPTVYIDPDGRAPVLEGMRDELGAWRERTINVADGLENGAINFVPSMAMGLGAGLLGVMEFGVGMVNTGVDLAVDAAADKNSTSFYVQESRRSLSDTRGRVSGAIEVVAEDPKGVGMAIMDTATATIKDFARGDTGATANVFQSVFDLTIGSKAGITGARVTREAGAEGVDLARRAARKVEDGANNAIERMLLDSVSSPNSVRQALPDAGDMALRAKALAGDSNALRSLASQNAIPGLRYNKTANRHTGMDGRFVSNKEAMRRLAQPDHGVPRTLDNRLADQNLHGNFVRADEIRKRQPVEAGKKGAMAEGFRKLLEKLNEIE